MKSVLSFLLLWAVASEDGKLSEMDELLAFERMAADVPAEIVETYSDADGYDYSFNETPPNWIANPNCCHHQGTMGNEVKGAGPHIWNQDPPTGVGRADPCLGEIVHITQPDVNKIADALCDNRTSRDCFDTKRRTIFLDFTWADFRDHMGNQSGLACRHKVCSDRSQDYWFDDIDHRLGIWCTEPESQIISKKAAWWPFLVGSNKTVIGTRGGTRILGKGFKVNGGNSNVIIRNIHISDMNAHLVRRESDAIIIDNGHRVVIEHCNFSDIGRFPIRLGPGPATEIAIINNGISGMQAPSPTCNGRKPFFINLNATVQSVTVARNHFFWGGGGSEDLLQGHALVIGAPGVTNMKSYVHSFNNWFYDHTYGEDIFRTLTKTVSLYGGDESYLLDEGNYYEFAGRYVNTTGVLGAGVGLAQWPANEAVVDSLGLQLFGRTLERCGWMPDYPGTNGAYFPNRTEVLNKFQQFHQAGKLANRWYGAYDYVKTWNKQFAGVGQHLYLSDYFQLNGQKPPPCNDVN